MHTCLTSGGDKQRYLRQVRQIQTISPGPSQLMLFDEFPRVNYAAGDPGELLPYMK